jgi:uncharacterized membrane protein YfcA
MCNLAKNMTTIIIYILLGLAIGYIGGYAGIGGAPFMIAFLVLVMGINQFTAQGSVLTMMLGPMSLLGILTMKKEVKAQWKNIVIGVISYAIFSYFGAQWAFILGELDTKKYFAMMLIIIGMLQLIPQLSRPDSEAKATHIPTMWMFIIGIATGIIGGLFGIGAGVLMVPLFMMVFNMNKNYARALSLAILLPPVSLGAFIKYNQQNAIDWQIVSLLFISYFIANYLGVKQGSKASLSSFKKYYALLLIAIAGVYFMQTAF